MTNRFTIYKDLQSIKMKRSNLCCFLILSSQLLYCSFTTEQLKCLSLRVAARRLPRCSHQRGVVTKLRRERIVIGCNMINLALYCMYRTCTQCLHSLVRVVIISSLKDIYMYSSTVAALFEKCWRISL